MSAVKIGLGEEAAERARSLDWRMHDLAVMPVEEVPEELPQRGK